MKTNNYCLMLFNLSTKSVVYTRGAAPRGRDQRLCKRVS